MTPKETLKNIPWNYDPKLAYFLSQKGVIQSQIQLLKSLKEKMEGEKKEEFPEHECSYCSSKEYKKNCVYCDNGVQSFPDEKAIGFNSATQTHIDTLTKLISEYEELLPTRGLSK